MSRAIHQNLDTAFVNINALMRYLCHRGFVGQIHIEMSGYDADIFLLGDNQVEVVESDHLTGRIADGEEALQRLLIRAGEPGGIINVIQKDSFELDIENRFTLKPEPQIPMVQMRGETAIESAPMEIEVEGVEETLNLDSQPSVFTQLVRETPTSETLNNQSLSEEEWVSLLKLTVELLASIDRTLGFSGLEFQAAFAKASAELAEDYDFLRSIEYSNGRLTVSSRPAPAIFIGGLMEVLRKVMGRLGSNPQFTGVHRDASEKLVDLVHRNKDEYDRYQVTAPLYRVLGVNAYPNQ